MSWNEKPTKSNTGVEVSTGASIECSFASFISACNWNSKPTINFSFSLDWFQQFLSAFGSLVLIISLFIPQSGRRHWRNWRRVRQVGWKCIGTRMIPDRLRNSSSRACRGPLDEFYAFAILLLLVCKGKARQLIHLGACSGIMNRIGEVLFPRVGTFSGRYKSLLLAAEMKHPTMLQI